METASRGTRQSMRSATNLLDIRQKAGPDSVYWLGSAKFTNDGCLPQRKLAAFWGDEQFGHQAASVTRLRSPGRHTGATVRDQQLQRHPPKRQDHFADGPAIPPRRIRCRSHILGRSYRRRGINSSSIGIERPWPRAPICPAPPPIAVGGGIAAHQQNGLRRADVVVSCWSSHRSPGIGTPVTVVE